MKRIRKTVAPCALCSEIRELQDSHIIPQGCYNRIRRHERAVVNIANGRAFLSQKQLCAKLLCRDCEKTFDSKGEKYFLGQCLQRDGSFPIDDKILGEPTAFVPVGKGSQYWRSASLGISYGPLAYFAASLFWRTWAAKEKLPKGTITLELPSELNESLKKYLLGKTPIIQNAAIVINVVKRLPSNFVDLRYKYSNPQELPTNAFDFPAKFYAAECLGFVFWLFFADEPELAYIRSHCILHNNDHPIFVSDAVRDVSARSQVSWVLGSKPSKNLRAYRP